MIDWSVQAATIVVRRFSSRLKTAKNSDICQLKSMQMHTAAYMQKILITGVVVKQAPNANATQSVAVV
jgi:hypothetical protein